MSQDFEGELYDLPEEQEQDKDKDDPPSDDDEVGVGVGVGVAMGDETPYPHPPSLTFNLPPLSLNHLLTSHLPSG